LGKNKKSKILHKNDFILALRYTIKAVLSNFAAPGKARTARRTAPFTLAKTEEQKIFDA
jgi:hypothetical protein